MACEILGAGTATVKQLRGELYNAHATDVWGAEEIKKPHLFICFISDADVDVVKPFITAYAAESDGYNSPRWIMSQPEVVNADGKTYTWAGFQGVLVDQS